MLEGEAEFQLPSSGFPLLVQLDKEKSTQFTEYMLHVAWDPLWKKSPEAAACSSHLDTDL